MSNYSIDLYTDNRKILCYYFLVFCVGNTALALALKNGGLHKAKLLVINGSPLNVTNNDGKNLFTNLSQLAAYI